VVLKQLDLYQEIGADWLANGGPVLYLADQMRVGKTPQCVVACARAAFKRVLVICPAIARAGWLTEFKTFCPDTGFAENAVLVYGAKDVDRITEATRLVVVSTSLAVKGDVFAALYANGMVFGYDVVIIDEAHELTNREAKRTQRVFGPKCTGEGGLAGLAPRCWFVSGTPQRRDASDMFPFCRMAGLWKPSKTDFINKFCFGFHDGSEFKITGSKNLPLLKKMIDPYMLRRLRTDIADVKVTIGSISIEPRELSPMHHALQILAAQEPKFARQIADGIKAGDLSNIDAKSVSTIRRVIGLAKVQGMAEIIKNDLEADPGLKVAIFGIHRDPLRHLRHMLVKYKACLLFGGTAAERRDHMLHMFQTNHQHRVFIGNLASAGMAIDLSAADRAYIFEPSWIPTDNAQALSRVIKIRDPDQLKEVLFVGLSNSIDDAVTRICERRTAEIETLYLAV
jgi:SNF2 family DNA or RNA helicase